MIQKPLIPFFLLALCAGVATQAALAGTSEQPASEARAAGKPAPRAGSSTPTSQAVQQAAQPSSQGNHDQYSLRPEREAQPRSSFGLRMKPGWASQGEDAGGR
ncbi:hypothetical protein AB4Z48_09430 [Cupriavidus sp. 2TAF22]|uniref:hypothetical protein n=1 Tax=unclassified Cupriavidus TaxID=2640874 RepID=UPI003F922B83